MEATRILDVDEVAYPVHFQGFHQELHVWLRGGEHVSLRPWTCGEHLAALGRHLRPGAGGAALDPAAFCGEVLARDGLVGARAEELVPLALWWAAGGGVAPVRAGADGWVELGPCRARLRAWTYGERLRALAVSTREEADGQRRFDTGRYLGAMLEASVKEVVPATCEVRGLDSASTVALLDAVVALNAGEVEATVSPEEAAVTLRLCRELGWTPSQVWATPAPEVDHLLRLLDAVQGPRVERPVPVAAPVARPVPASPRLADFPDAIVIQIEDEPS
jgi:hypothetical protein